MHWLHASCCGEEIVLLHLTLQSRTYRLLHQQDTVLHWPCATSPRLNCSIGRSFICSAVQE